MRNELHAYGAGQYQIHVVDGEAIELEANDQRGRAYVRVVTPGDVSLYWYPIRKVNGAWLLGCPLPNGGWMSFSDRLTDTRTVGMYVGETGGCPVGAQPLPVPTTTG